MALANVRSISEVLVTGSMARTGCGNDLDVVLVVDQFAYVTYLKRMWNAVSYKNARISRHDYRSERASAAFDAITFAPAEWGWCELALEGLGAKIDVQLMPEGWLQNIGKVQTHLPHSDPHFVRNIARDARRLRVRNGGHGTKLVLGWEKPALVTA